MSEQHYKRQRVTFATGQITLDRLTIRAALLGQISSNLPSRHVDQLKLDRKATDSAVLSMTQNVAARLDVKSRKSESSLFAFLISLADSP